MQAQVVGDDENGAVDQGMADPRGKNPAAGNVLPVMDGLGVFKDRPPRHYRDKLHKV